MWRHRRLSVIILCLAFLPACRGGDETATGSGDAAGPEAVATVVAASATRGPVEETVETFGSVEFDPHQTRTVAFLKSGRVQRVMVNPGQSIGKGDPLLSLGPLPSSSPEVEQAQVNLRFAQRKLDRARRLLTSHLATNETVQEAEKEVADARAALAGLGIDDAGEARAIEAPFSGVVVKVLVTSGAIVHPGEGALMVAPAGGLVVRAGFEPEDAARLEAGKTVHIAPVFGANDQSSVDAVLARLHRVADSSTQLVEALIQPQSVPSWMMAGVRVRVAVVVRAAHDAVRIPREALITRGGQPGVFVVDQGTAHWRAVHIGIETDRWIEILDGVDEGATVVTTGRTSLEDGMAVAPTQVKDER